MEKLIISAAICGAEVTKEQNPAVPYTVEEIAREAKSAYDAGASVIHLHVRWDDGTPTQDKGRFQGCVEAVSYTHLDVDKRQGQGMFCGPSGPGDPAGGRAVPGGGAYGKGGGRSPRRCGIAGGNGRNAANTIQ